MRITIPIVSAGNRWTAKLPRVDLDACYPIAEDGRPSFCEESLRRQLRDCPHVQFSSGDFGTSAVAFAAVLLSSIGDWMDDNTKDAETLPRVKTTLRRFDSRIGRGQQTYCRIDIRRCRQRFRDSEIYGIKVEIDTNDRGVVQTAAFEREFAMMVMDFCETYSKRYSERGDPPLVFGPSALQIANELHERTVEDERERMIERLNVDRWKCERRTASGHCSPCKFDCPCFSAGLCVDAKA